MKPRIVFGLGLVLTLLPGIATAQCPVGLFYADTVTGQVANFLPGSFVDLVSAANPDPECPMRTLKVTVDIPEACSRAVIWLQLEGQPEGWSFHLADSPTNDGFGGDSGTTDHDAELQVLNQVLSVYSASTGPDDLDLLAVQRLALEDGAVNVVVENQALSWGQPFSALDSTNGGKLFAIPDPEADGRRVYVGLNRVVASIARTGCGARRVLISFE